jgi:hypothetical protein
MPHAPAITIGGMSTPADGVDANADNGTSRSNAHAVERTQKARVVARSIGPPSRATQRVAQRRSRPAARGMACSSAQSAAKCWVAREPSGFTHITTTIQSRGMSFGFVGLIMRLLITKARSA